MILIRVQHFVAIDIHRAKFESIELAFSLSDDTAAIDDRTGRITFDKHCQKEEKRYHTDQHYGSQGIVKYCLANEVKACDASLIKNNQGDKTLLSDTGSCRE